MAYQSILNPMPVTGALTDAQLRATAIPMSGTITVANASLAVTGAFYQAIQPVSGTVGISGTVPISGTFWQATQPVSLASTTITGSVAVTGPLTDTQLRASAVPVSGSFFQATQPVSIGATVAVSAASLPLPTGAATAAKQPALGTAGTASTDVITVQGIASGVAQPVTGTVTVGNASLAVTGTFWQATQPVSGTITVGNASLAVTGSFFQATQPVSIATMPSTPVTGTFWQATQPVSIAATVAISAASLPLPTGAATETTLAALNTKVTAVNTGAVTISAALPTGANVIGGVTVADVTSPGTLAAAAQMVSLSVAGGMNAATAQITGTWVGTIQFEGTVDGTNWVPINGVYAGGTAPGPTITANGVVRLTPGGLASIRLNMTAWTSGTATITLRASRGTGGTFLNQSLPIGANVIGALTANQSVNSTQINGVALLAGNGITGTGSQRVTIASDNSPVPVTFSAAAATYSASIVGLSPAALATDIFTITGSATKTVRISRILVNGVQTTAGQVSVMAVKRSTANTVGTSTAPTRVPYDSTSAAATATVLAYTANPTLGTTVGTITSSRLFVPGTASASDAQGLQVLTGDVGQQFITLRGIAEVVAVNLNGVTVTGAALNITVEWTES